MLNNEGFDLWANGYDKSVGISDDANTYPFAGYKNVLNTIYNAVLAQGKGSVLDIGFGTGTLTQKLYEQGCKITGVDFSQEMIRIASEKMPDALLIRADFSQGLPAGIASSNFDFILATYSLHHIPDGEKAPYIESLIERLRPNGSILVGDVAFESRALLNSCKDTYSDRWDDDEFYFVYDELKDHFKDRITFQKLSFCAGVLTITR